MKHRPNGSAASTVAASTGGGSTGNFAAHVMQSTFVASRIEVKGWRTWRNIHGIGIAMRPRNLVSKVKIMIPDADAKQVSIGT